MSPSTASAAAPLRATSGQRRTNPSPGTSPFSPRRGSEEGSDRAGDGRRAAHREANAGTGSESPTAALRPGRQNQRGAAASRPGGGPAPQVEPDRRRQTAAGTV